MKTFFFRALAWFYKCMCAVHKYQWLAMLHHTYNAMSMRYVRALPSISLCWGDIFFKNRRAAPCSPKGTHLHTQWRHQETTTTAINTMNTTCRIAPNSFYYVEKNVLSSFNVNSEFSHLLFYFKLFCFVGFLRFVCVQAQEFPHLFAFRMYTNRNKNQSTHTAFLFQSMNVFMKLH